jgi:hypothetical protein
MSSQLKQVYFRSPEQAIAKIVNDQGKPSERLLELLELHKIIHNGTLKNIVETTQKAFHILHPSGRPKKRWEINHAAEDAKFSNIQKDQTLSILSEFGLFSEFMPTEKHFDYVFFHGSTLHDALLRQQALLKAWQQGMRFDKMIVLSGPRLVEQHEKSNGRYGTELEMMQYLWTNAVLPAGMEHIDYTWINSPDRIGPNGAPVWANTRDSFESWYDSNQPVPTGSCLGVSNAPFTLRQHIITQTFLLKQGFINCPIETVGGPLPGPASIAICLREFSNILWDYQYHVLCH